MRAAVVGLGRAIARGTTDGVPEGAQRRVNRHAVGVSGFNDGWSRIDEMMADNRMFLVHVPTGLAAPLGKRMVWGWHMSDGTQQKMGDRVALLFQILEEEHSYDGRQDDFAVALEDASGASLATGKWQYGEHRTDGLVQLVMSA